MNTDGIEAIISNLWMDIQREYDKERAFRIKADPVGHKKTKYFPADARMSYRFYREKNGRGQEVRYCWSTERNLAGYFLCWREVRGKKTGKRDMWRASKQRQVMKRCCLDRWNKHKAKVRCGPPIIGG
jgi:hypothetical protein